MAYYRYFSGQRCYERLFKKLSSIAPYPYAEQAAHLHLRWRVPDPAAWGRRLRDRLTAQMQM
jgi:hypothetical protein